MNEKLKGIVLVPTYRCNLTCDYCYNPAPRDMRTVLPLEAVRKVLGEAAAMGANALDLVGGEPTTLPVAYLEDIVRYSAEMKKAVSTNGMLAMRRPDMVDVLRDFDVLQISIHPFRFTKQELISHVSMLAQMIRTLDKEPDDIVVNMVIDKRTAELLRDEPLFESIASILEDLTTTFEVNVANLVGHAVTNREVIPTVSEILELRSAIHMLESTANAHGIKLATNLKNYFLPRPNLWGRNAALIDPMGNVLPMDESTIDLVHRGIVEFKTWEAPLGETWNESDSINLFRGDDWVPDSCRACPLLKWCGGGSRMDALVVGGDLFGEDPFCLCSTKHKEILRAYGEDSDLGEVSLSRFYEEAVEFLKLAHASVNA